MAQTGYTPILIYSSSTVSQAPAAGNLTNSTLGSELAINITDGKLFYKDNANAIQVIGWKTVPTTAGGTGLTTYAAGDLLFYASGTALSKLTIGASATVLTSSGSAPQWTAQSALSVGTAANLLSNATTGVMQIVGPSAGTTRVMTIPNANFTAARTDAAQTFTGTQSIEGILNVRSGNAVRFNNPTNGNFSQISNTSGGEMRLATGSGDSLLLSAFDATLLSGNLVIGTSGKGIDFSATPGTGTSELLADYEEGTWTPTDASGAGLSLTGTSNNCFYTRIGNQVTCIFSLTYPSTASAAAATIGGLPFTSKNTSNSVAGGFTTFTSNGSDVVFLIGANDTIFGIRSITGISGVTNVSLSTAQIRGVLQYLV